MSSFKVALTLFKVPTNVMMVIEFIMCLKAFFSEKRFSNQETVTEVHIHKLIGWNLLTRKTPKYL